MASGKARPPFATLEGGWDAAGVPAPPPKSDDGTGAAPADPGAIDADSPRQDGESASPDASAAVADTVTLPGAELDALVGETNAERTPVLDSAEVDRMLGPSAPANAPPVRADEAPSAVRPRPAAEIVSPSVPPPPPLGAIVSPSVPPPPAWRGSMPSIPPEGLAGAVAPAPPGTQWPSVPPPAPKERKPLVPLRRVLSIVGGVCAIAFVGVAMWLFGRPKPVPGVGLVLPAAAASAAPDAATAARDALDRLRQGLRACVQNQIGVLPGTSPAVPASAAAFRGGAYQSAPADWRTPVWACTKFQMSEPQSFQIQWQQTKTNTEGDGVAWIDDDHDGKPDRAFGFHATLKKRGLVDIGDIVPFDANHAIAPPR